TAEHRLSLRKRLRRDQRRKCLQRSIGPSQLLHQSIITRLQICQPVSDAFALCLQCALLGLDDSNLSAQAVLLRAGSALGQFHQLLELLTLLAFLGAIFLAPPLQAGFVLPKRDADNVIPKNTLTAELGLASACLALLRRC